jgi:transcriptional regulator
MVYLPPAFTETRPAVLAAHIEKHDFALLVSNGESGLVASHIPFLVERDSAQLHLLGHLARPNPQVEHLRRGLEVLTIFSGPHAYISPSWYAAGPAVPTWNYVDVHAYGTARLVDDADWLRGLVRRLSDRHEAGSAAPWRMQDLPKAYLDSMIKGIIGFEISVTRLEGKYKLSQNRPEVDRPHIIAALERRGDADARAVAALMRATEPA